MGSTSRGGFEKPLILVAGAYGHGNVGDDAIGVAIQQLLGNLAPDVEVVVLGGEPSRLSLLNGARGCHLRWKSPLRAAALFSLVKRASAVLIGGGGLLSDLFHFYRPYYVLATVANVLRVPVMFYAVGAYPPHTRLFKALTPLVMNRAAAVTVRDDFSMRALAEAGVSSEVTLTADPAITFGPALPRKAFPQKCDHPLVGVSVRPLPRADAAPGHVVWLAKTLANCLDAVVAKTDARLRLLPMQFGGYDDDVCFQQAVTEQMSRKETTENVLAHSPYEVFSAIGECDVMIGMRLHSNVLATAASVPSIAIAYDPKVRAFMCGIGSEDQVIELDDLRPEAFAERVSLVLRAREALTRRLLEGKRRLVETTWDCAERAVRLAGAEPVLSAFPSAGEEDLTRVA